jgi:hypothetical protein
VDVEEIGQRIVVFIEEVLVQFGPAHYLAAALAEKLDKGVLSCGQDDGHTALGYGFSADVDLDAFAHRNRIFRDASTSADQGAQTGEEFVEIEGLCQVIVGACVESAQ